jgi:hypothetical protein
MAKSRSTPIAALAAGLMIAPLPAAAFAQEAPAAPTTVREVETGTRIQTITIFGAIRDPRAPKRTVRAADRNLPQLPVTYEDSGARPAR